jgi:hypothetical protein
MSSAAKKAWRTRRHHLGHKSSGKKKKWMSGAVKRPGALTSKITRRFGKEGFDKKGRIKISVLQAMKSDPKLDTLTKQQVQFRLNTRGVHR